MHARLPKLIDEVLPHEEVQQLSRLGHHHLALCHIVERLVGIKIRNMRMFSMKHLFVVVVDDCFTSL